MVLKKDNRMTLFLILIPFIDVLSSIFFKNNINLSLIIKFAFLGYAIFYLLKNTQHKKIFLFLAIYFCMYITYLLYKNLNLLENLNNTMNIFYLPFASLFFNEYQNNKITKKTISIIFLIYLFLYSIPLLFNLKIINLNEFINLFIILFTMTIVYLIESNSYLLKGIYLCLTLTTALFINSKILYLGIILTCIYFLTIKRKKVVRFLKKNNLKTLLTIMVLLIGIAAYIPNIKERSSTFMHNDTDLSTFEKVDKYLFSNHLTNIKEVNENFQNSTSLEKIFGFNEIKKQKTEIDILDIFYTMGIIGILTFSIFFIYTLKQTKLQNKYKFTFILLIIFTCFTGNILSNPFVTFWLSILFLISKNDQGVEKTNILLVSNMYPSTTYPHYGIFVKNTYDLLTQNGYTIDLIVMYKTKGFLNKFIAYIRLCGISLLKSIWNNYDYIYVHFANHTTAGILIPSLFLKKTKLVLNVHGNDIVADTKEDESYLWISKFSLKYADTVIAPSKYFAEVLKKQYHIPKEKIVIYPSGGVDTNKFRKIEKREAKQKLKLKSNIKYFGFVARIEKDKGYDTLLLAINELKKMNKLKDIKFILVGSGVEEPILDKMINELKLSDYIIRKPFLSQEELVFVYNSIEALIYPTRRKSESLGLTGLEAMACENLVIGSNKYGPSDYLENKKNSLTFNPTNHELLAKLIVEAINMKKTEKETITKNARKKSEEYNSQNTKQTILKVFKH